MGFTRTKYINRLPEIAKRAKLEAGKISPETATSVLSLAQQFAPVLTGELRDSGVVEQESETRFIVKFTAPHSRMVHFGTVFQSANPFLFTAIEMTRREFREAQKSFFQRVRA